MQRVGDHRDRARAHRRGGDHRVEAASATYLIGSDLPGVMTPVSKVAFASREAAVLAKQRYGGEIGSFATAIAASFEETANSLVRRYGNDRERLRRQGGG